MSIEETRELWERFKSADQAHDAGGTAAVYAEDVVLRGTPLRGRETLRRFDADFWAAFPDYRREYLQEVVDDNSVAVLWRVTATHQGRWMGIEPTGMALDWPGCSVFTFRDGHIAEAQVFQRDIIGQLRREANLQLVRRLYDAENSGDIEAVLAFLADDVVVRVNGREATSSRDGYRPAAQQTQSAFPDWRHETLASFCEETWSSSAGGPVGRTQECGRASPPRATASSSMAPAPSKSRVASCNASGSTWTWPARFGR